jgi:hypothetical protein
MTGAEAIAVARTRGVALAVFLDKLRVYSEGEPDESLIRLLRANKQEVMDAILAAETQSDRWRRILAEKLETIMTIRGLTLHDAEREAFEHVVIEHLNDTHPNTDPRVCANCRGPDLPLTPTLPFGVGERHAWLHQRCWVPWRERRRTEAIAALAAIGISESASSTRLRLPPSGALWPPCCRGLDHRLDRRARALQTAVAKSLASSSGGTDCRSSSTDRRQTGNPATGIQSSEHERSH